MLSTDKMTLQWIRDQYWNGGWPLLELSRATGMPVAELKDIIEPDVNHDEPMLIPQSTKRK